jgi:hypothetical protein
MKFLQFLAMMSLPCVAFAAPADTPATEKAAAVADKEVPKVLTTINPTSPPLISPSPPMAVTARESFQLTLSDDKKVIHLMGSFRSGISAALKTMLVKNPTVETVVLSSPGGSMIDGIAVEKIIRQHGVNTHVELMCASACSEAFQGGEKRTVAPTGRLGFHQATQGIFQAALVGDERESASNQLIVDIWKRRGLSDAFIERTMKTLNRDIWLPSNAELLAENIVTSFTEGGDPGIAPVGKWRSAAAMEQEVLTGPIWAYARTHRPKLYLRSATVFWIGDIIENDAGPLEQLAETTLLAALLKDADWFSDALLLRFIASEHANWTNKSDVLNKRCRGAFRSNFPISSGDTAADRQALILEIMQAHDGERIVEPKRYKASQSSVIEFWSDMVAIGEYDSDSVTRNFCTEPVNYYDALAQLPEAKRLEYFRALAVTLLHPAPSSVKLNLP